MNYAPMSANGSSTSSGSNRGSGLLLLLLRCDGGGRHEMRISGRSRGNVASVNDLHPGGSGRGGLRGRDGVQDRPLRRRHRRSSGERGCDSGRLGLLRGGR